MSTESSSIITDGSAVAECEDCLEQEIKKQEPFRFFSLLDSVFGAILSGIGLFVAFLWVISLDIPVIIKAIHGLGVAWEKSPTFALENLPDQWEVILGASIIIVLIVKIEKKLRTSARLKKALAELYKAIG